MSLAPLYVFLGDVSVQVLCPFFNWVVCLPGVESCEFFIYFGDQSLFWGIIGKYVFPYSWFSFHFADVFLSHAEAFYFEEVPFVYSFLYVFCSRWKYWWKYCFMGYLKFSCLCSPIGLLWCHDLYLSLLWYMLVVEFHFFARSCPDLPTPFVEEAIFTPFYAPTSFVKY